LPDGISNKDNAPPVRVEQPSALKQTSVKAGTEHEKNMLTTRALGAHALDERFCAASGKKPAEKNGEGATGGRPLR